jgi:glutaredoxin
VNSQLKESIRDLLTETAHAHHRAFEATAGDDPDWAIWYADSLQKPLAELLGTELTRSRLIYCLMFVEYERQARDPQAAWADYYAEHLIERFAAAETPEADRLALYHFPRCRYCALVRDAIDRLGIDVELRDIRQDERYWDELVETRGRSTVPVLRITTPQGEERWMPESREIVEYLDKTYG